MHVSQRESYNLRRQHLRNVMSLAPIRKGAETQGELRTGIRTNVANCSVNRARGPMPPPPQLCTSNILSHMHDLNAQTDKLW